MFINHPNAWIREEVGKYVEYLSNPDHKILSKAEVYCLVRPEVKKYKKLDAAGAEKERASQPVYKREKMVIEYDPIPRGDSIKIYRILQSTAVAQLSSVTFGVSHNFLYLHSEK